MSAEGTRMSAEATRMSAEATRMSAEATRMSAEGRLDGSGRVRELDSDEKSNLGHGISDRSGQPECESVLAR